MILHACLAWLRAGAHCLSLHCSESFIKIHSMQRIGVIMILPYCIVILQCYQTLELKEL